MSEWQTIDTAPLDTSVLIFREDIGVIIGMQYAGLLGRPRSWSAESGEDVYKNPPTHWMPLPKPPT